MVGKKFNSVKQLLNDHEWLTDVLSTASYGNSWFQFGTHVDTPDEVYETAKSLYDCREEIWAYVLQHGGFLLVTDIEDCDCDDDEDYGKDYKISLKDFKNKFMKFVLNYPNQYAAIMDETMDLYDADALLQVVVFGEVVYG